ncbi:type III pantothenate kinase [Paenactinomyces guangxiensis]|uniref:Type III pantothenate kinase n=1 Tax=Paenactinomyces guangxiensis TaxID=1490290 RepID=A0A7W1WTL0_9BACL|nr:type III pantothenate kinase [Paenactinomyces guangxiensis]MBA4495802.1 type III pantothenate kinase [Paenactinomyces guangxiensis]MBH8592892.1 type III pantothenate kinase [Paenactinomyces guangxiensis]
MLLVMDAGNTNIVLGVYKKEQLLHHWRLQTDRNATEDEYGMTLKGLLSHVGFQLSDVGGVIISSVVPPLTFVLRKLTEKYLGQTPLVLGPGVKTGLNIKYENPREVGADRIANAVAAIKLYGAPVIIVDFGTATTICFVDEQGNYIGGAITPGVNISAEALYQRAAKLTRVEITKPDSVVGRNTVQAVQAGIYYGYVGVVDGIVSRMKSLLTKRPRVVATGGLAQLISGDTETIDVVDPLLTLEGLKIIFERNQK